MTDPTNDELLSHLSRWRKREFKRGMVVNKFGEVDEALRWLCRHCDALKRRVAVLEARKR